MVICIDEFKYVHNKMISIIRNTRVFLIIYLILGIHKTSDDIELSEAIKRSFNIQTSHECSENGTFIYFLILQIISY